MKAPVLLFDLDRTLLDVQLMLERLAQRFDHLYSSFGAAPGSFQMWSETYARKIGTANNYSLSTLAQHLHAELQKLELVKGGERTLVTPSVGEIEQQLTQIVQTVANDCLYPDVLEALETLEKEGCIICLFSQGVITWQKLKIAHTALASTIAADLQFVSIDKTSKTHLEEIQAVLQQKGLHDRAVWLIDDKDSILRLAHSHWLELQTIRMSREPTNEAGDVTKLDQDQKVITNLTELISMVQHFKKAASPISK